MREAFYPALFEELGIPFTGSDAYTNAITLDKWLTKLLAAACRRSTPRAALLVTVRNFDQVVERGAGLAFPVIVKPNHEGSSKGIYNGLLGCSVTKEPRDFGAAAQERAPRLSGRRARRGVHRRHRRRGRLHRGRRPRRRPADPGRAGRTSNGERPSTSTTTGSRTSSPARSSTAARRTCRATSPRACARSRTRCCARSAFATWRASTSGSPARAGSSCSRSTRCPRSRRTRACSRPPRRSA